MPIRNKWTKSTVEITIFNTPNRWHHLMEEAVLGIIDFVSRTYLCTKARKAWRYSRINIPTFEKEWWKT